MAEHTSKLVVLNGLEQGNSFELDPSKTNLIGRSDECDVLLSDTSVSRQHVQLKPMNNGAWVVRDESSRNGTFVNEVKIDSGIDHPLEHKDILRVGIYDIRYEKSGEPSLVKDLKESDESAQNDPAVLALETDKDELFEAGSASYKEGNKGPKLGKGIVFLIILAVIAALVGLGFHFGSDHFKTTSEENLVFEEEVLSSSETVSLESEESDEAEDPMDSVQEEDLPEETPDPDVTVEPTPKVLDTQNNSSNEPTEPVEELPEDELDIKEPVTPKSTDPKPNASTTEFRIFLDIKTEPLSAQIYLGEERLGQSPIKQNLQLVPGKTYDLYADFELRELGDIYRKKVSFKVKPDADLVEMKITADLAALKIQKLPRYADFYLEGFYKEDPVKSRPVKIYDISYGRPIYLPYGDYRIEIKQKTKLPGSDNEVVQIKYQREVSFDAGNDELVLKLSDNDLKKFPVKIKSSPDHAKIYYKGEKLGVTPYEGVLPVGDNELVVKKDGYFDEKVKIRMDMNAIYETTVQLKTSRLGEEIIKAKTQIQKSETNLALQTLTEALKIDGSENEKAEVYYLLGQIYLIQKNYEAAKTYYDKSAQTKDFASKAGIGLAKCYHYLGEQQKALKQIVSILVSIDETTDQELKIEANNAFKLISPVRSVVYLYTEPKDAKVFVNGKQILQTTPVILSELTLGSQNFRFEKPGFKTYKTKQNLKVGEFVIVKVKLTPDYK